MNLKTLALASAVALTATAVSAADLIKKESAHSPKVTMDRLVAAVNGAGAKVFARIDHAAGAKSIDQELTPTEVLIFGNPKIGTPVMLANPAAGLDLPLRAVAYQANDGKTYLVYHNPERLVNDHGVPADLKAIKMMTGALNKLTDKATSK